MKSLRSARALIGALAALWLAAATVAAAPFADLSARTTSQEVPFPDQRAAAQAAAVWLVETHQNDDGGYTSFSAGSNVAPSDVGGTIDAILALGSVGYNVAAAAPGKEASTLGYLLENGDALEDYASADASQAGKAVMAMVGASVNPRDFGGVNYASTLLDHLNFAGFFDVETAFNQSLAIMALAALGEPVPAASVEWLAERQAGDGAIGGSWDDGFGTDGNADATAMSVMAMAASGITETVDSLAGAAGFLESTRLPTGGWEYGAGFGENANSTALVVQALSALHVDFYSQSGDSPSAMQALLAWQGESGAFQADFGDGPFDDFYTTVQALPALSGRPYPFAGRLEVALRAVDCLATLQDPATGGWEQFATFGVNAAGTSRAIQAIVAVGDDPAAERWAPAGINPVQALGNLTPAYLSESRGGGAGIVMQGVVAAGGDVGNFAGVDLPLVVTGHLSPTGEYDDTAFGPYSHGEAMLGLLSAGLEPDPLAAQFLLESHTGGDWGGADSTGIALNVLSRMGMTVSDALHALRLTQESDGGWGFGEANANSTSEVVQGLVAAGENPFTPAWSKVVSGTISSPANVILAQQEDNGCWPNLFGPGDDPFATTDAVLLMTQNPVWGSETEFVEAVPILISTEPEEDEPEPSPTEAPAAPTAAPTEPAALVATAAPAEVAQAEPTDVPPEPEVISVDPAADDGGDGGIGDLDPVVIVVIVGAVAAVAIGLYYGRRTGEKNER